MTSLVHDAVRMRATRTLFFKTGGPKPEILAVKGGDKIPVDAWGGTSYGWFAEDAPAPYRGRKFLLRDMAVYLGPKPRACSPTRSASCSKRDSPRRQHD